jgi:hypothetical protein
MGKVQDITGDRFGKLVAQRCETRNYDVKPGNKEDRKTRTRVWWLCKCDCGKEIWIPSSALRYRRKSCGCDKPAPPIEDLTGQKFHHLTPVSIARTRNTVGRRTSPTLWLCVCDCGKSVTTSITCLKGGKRKSCGCVGQPKLRKRPYGSIYKALQRRSSKFIVDISYEDFIEFTKVKECHYCEDEVTWSQHNVSTPGNPCRVNLDRKDNDRGYTLDNVVVCCRRCNVGRNCLFSYEEWVAVGKCLRNLRLSKQ